LQTSLELHLGELEPQIRSPFPHLRESELPFRSALIPTNSLDRSIAICHKIAQHGARLVKRTEPVVFAHTILLQEVIVEYACQVPASPRFLRGYSSYELNDFREILFLQNLFGAASVIDKGRSAVDIIWLGNLESDRFQFTDGKCLR
jgi:hypothetical protein